MEGEAQANTVEKRNIQKEEEAKPATHDTKEAPLKEQLEEFKGILLNPIDFLKKHFAVIRCGLRAFFDKIEFKVHPKKNEVITGITNLGIFLTCIVCFFLTFSIESTSGQMTMRKILCEIFEVLLGCGAFFGFMIHTFEYKKVVYDGLWHCLYVFLLIAVAFRFILHYMECNTFTFIVMTPLTFVGIYVFVLACWYTDKFFCIGGFCAVFGLFMALSHIVFLFTRGTYYFGYLFDNLIAVVSFVVQVTSMKIGDMDKNGVFHFIVMLYVIVFQCCFQYNLKVEC